MHKILDIDLCYKHFEVSLLTLCRFAYSGNLGKSVGTESVEVLRFLDRSEVNKTANRPRITEIRTIIVNKYKSLIKGLPDTIELESS